MNRIRVRRWSFGAGLIMIVAAVVATSQILTNTPARAASAPIVSNPGYQTGQVGVNNAFGMLVTGGTAPFRWSAQGLPAGKSINVSTGAITGVPQAAGDYSVRVTVVDAYGASGPYGTVTFGWHVNPPTTYVTVPNLEWSTVSQATSALTAVGLVLGTVSYFPDYNCEYFYQVAYQTPAAGTSVGTGTSVNVSVGYKPSNYSCP